MYRLSVNTGTVRLVFEQTFKGYQSPGTLLSPQCVHKNLTDYAFLVRGWEKSVQQMTHVYM